MRLIDADALENKMYHEAFENDASYNESNPMAKWDSGLWIRYKLFENIINEAPSIDIEQKHGEWIDRGMRVPSSWVKKCSLCGHETDTWRWCKFCPNCGAKMSNASNASNTLETLEKGETE